MNRNKSTHMAGSPASSGQHSRSAVVMTHVDAIGLRLVVSLLQSGYVVYSRDVSASFRPAFEAAGGRLLESGVPEQERAWSIECRGQSDPGPETLSMLNAGRSSYGRARLELTGSQHMPDDAAERSVAVLQVRAPGQTEATLRVVLGVSPRGPELSVQGERRLFEDALPLLTALADRVLYAGSERTAVDGHASDPRQRPCR